MRPCLAYRLGNLVITVNTRAQAEYALAGVKPTDVVIRAPTLNEIERLLEADPSLRIIITKS